MLSQPLSDLAARGVSIWLDTVDRSRLRDGTLRRLVEQRGVVGVTSNPTIFRKALADSTAYADEIRDLALRGVGVDEAARLLTSHDIRWACDVLAPAYDRTDGRDGRVSIEVDPRLAGDAARTLAEARALAYLVDRPNVMIKIPATAASLPAIAAATAEGISINVTLVFSLDRYTQVLDAYMSGLEAAAGAGLDLSGIRSVASFFVSRVDTEVDGRLDRIATAAAAALRGEAALANARLAYERYERATASDRWAKLAASGAHPQRPLWASTGVKDPAYQDTRYVSGLVAPDTVNTMPVATLDAVADHARVYDGAVTGGYADARRVLAALTDVGVDYLDVVRSLEHDGVARFARDWEQLLDELGAQLESARTAQTAAPCRPLPAGMGSAGHDADQSAPS